MKLDLDIEQFWKDDELSHKERCFSPDAPQVALGIRMSDECVFAELGEPGNPWGFTPRERRIELNRRYNEKALKIVGRKFLKEEYPEADEQFPKFRQIGEVFGGEYKFDGNTTWLEGHVSTPRKLEKLLDHVDSLNIRDFALPACWEAEKKRIFEKYGKRPPMFAQIRGPVTLACSICGVENLIFLIYDEPDLAKRFSQTITRVVLDYARLFIEESGHTLSDFPHGFTFNDDDCCLLTPDMYEEFGAPVLKSVFGFMAPDPGDHRYQHSDSAMEHILPALSEMHLTGCNFGPTVTVNKIRKHMKDVTIYGCLAPFTFMSNDEDRIISEVRRDCEMAKASGIKGLCLKTAGSINNGSMLSSMRTVMAAIQNYGRY